ncbi:Ras guanine nucleotide exchange factor bud5 [Coemansia sp. RSA 486]|nr:Ras guanine nucleotide exchange factor bud5 [Coemansia sp. RSA 486]
MAFYFNQGNRRDKRHERTALGPSPLKPAMVPTSSNTNLDNNAPRLGKPKQPQKRREKIGDTFRFTRSTDRSTNPLRDIRLAKIFGEPVLDTSGSRHKIALVDAYSTRDILFNSAGRVSYGTWYGLIMYLTQAHQQIEEYTQAFFLTFRSFAAPKDLAEALVQRSRLQPSHGLSAADARLWKNRVREPIQYRVYMAIKLWYEHHWWADADDPVLSYLCGFLINEYLPTRHGSSAKECLRFLQTVQSKHKNINLRQLRVGRNTSAERSTSSSLHRMDADTEARSEGHRAGAIPGSADKTAGTGGSVYSPAINTTPSSRLWSRPLHNTQGDDQDNANNARLKKNQDGEQPGLLKKLFGRTNPVPIPSGDSTADEQSPAEDIQDHSSGNDEPDITDLLMATVGMDLSLEAYRRISNILSLNPLDVACQLTIIESSCYCQIRPYELLNKEFSRRERSLASNIRQMTRWSTQITRWASMLILKELTPERRCRVLRYFIELGIQLLALKNYDALMAVKGAIYCAGVMRLKKTWALLPKKFTIMCRRLLEAMSSDHNYANYREMLRRSQPPLLPFLGLYLTDLTFLEDGNPTYRRYEHPLDEYDAPTGGSKGAVDTGAEEEEEDDDDDDDRDDGRDDDDDDGYDNDDSGNNSRASDEDNPSADDTQNQPPTTPNNVQLTGQTCALFAQRSEVDLNNPSILINFEKSYRIAGVIQEIQKFQVEYSGNFTMAIPGLQQYLIEQWRLYEGCDDDKVYELSLEREPRASMPTQNNMVYPHHHHMSTGGGIRLSRLIPGRSKEQPQDNQEKREALTPIDTDDSGSSIE